jgi:hypothetical protein
MTPEDFDQFAEVLVGFAELHGKQLSAAAIELYWRALQHWHIKDFRAAAAYLVRTCPFMPKPADFERLRDAGKPTEGEAWAIALAHAAPPGWRSLAPCKDPHIDAVVRMLGGYSAIAMCPVDKLAFLERAFVQHYCKLRDAEELRTSVPQIARSNYRAGAIESAGQIAATIFPHRLEQELQVNGNADGVRSTSAAGRTAEVQAAWAGQDPQEHRMAARRTAGLDEKDDNNGDDGGKWGEPLPPSGYLDGQYTLCAAA